MLRSTVGMNGVFTVILRENQRNSLGRMEPVETGRVEVPGRLQESNTSEIQALALAGEKQVLNIKRLYTREFPGDYLSRVVDSNGIEYDIVGEPKRHRGSRRTARDVVTLRQRQTQSKGKSNG